VVTGEKIITLQLVQVAKGYKNEYPMLGGTAVPHYYGGYK